MANNKPPGVQYATRYCALLKREVRVVLVKQPNDSWQFVKCLDKEKACLGQRCLFSRDDRQQSYDPVWI